MNRERILELFRQLSMSQGFYGRLLRAIDNLDEEDRNSYLDSFKDCKDELDVILAVEC